MTQSLHLKIILGSTRQGRFSERPGAWIEGEASKLDGVEVEVLDLRDYPMPFFDEEATPSAKKEPYTNSVVAAWTAKIAEGDAFIVIAPEYNHGYSAVLKNAMDYVYQEWNGKPIAFVSYGSVLGARSVEQLREVAIELQMAPIRNAIHMPYDVIMQIKSGNPDAEVFAPYAEKAKGLFDQLLWWAKALKAARQGA